LIIGMACRFTFLLFYRFADNLISSDEGCTPRCILGDILNRVSCVVSANIYVISAIGVLSAFLSQHSGHFCAMEPGYLSISTCTI
jgi:hypothetical protein